MYQLLWYLLHGSPTSGNQGRESFQAFSVNLVYAIVTVTTEGLTEEGDPKKSTIVGINWPESKAKAALINLSMYYYNQHIPHV